MLSSRIIVVTVQASSFQICIWFSMQLLIDKLFKFKVVKGLIDTLYIVYFLP